MMKKPVTFGARNDIVLPEGDRRMWPLLSEYLTCAKWEDGSPRETSQVAVLVDKFGTLKAMLKDPAMGRMGFIPVKSMESAFATVEQALESDELEWIPMGGFKNGRR